MGAIRDQIPGGTGHTERLRTLLREARLARDLSAAEVCARIGARLRERDPAARDPHENSLYAWESMRRNPTIDHMAAWAYAVGLQLVVDLTERGERRLPTLLRTQEAVAVARLVDQMPAEQRAALLTLARGMRRDE